VTITSDSPLDGEICAGQSVAFLCSITSGYIAIKYQWRLGNEGPKTGDSTLVIKVFSKVKVTCSVTAIHSQDPSDENVTASSSVIALPGGKFTPMLMYSSFWCCSRKHFITDWPCGCVV